MDGERGEQNTEKDSNCLAMALSNGNKLAELVHGIEVGVFFFPIVITHHFALNFKIWSLTDAREGTKFVLKILVHFFASVRCSHFCAMPNRIT